MKGVPWRPIVRFGLIRCEGEVWSKQCNARATRFFAWSGRGSEAAKMYFEAACEWHAKRFETINLMSFKPLANLREMTREEWEICEVQEG